MVSFCNKKYCRRQSDCGGNDVNHGCRLLKFQSAKEEEGEGRRRRKEKKEKENKKRNVGLFFTFTWARVFFLFEFLSRFGVVRPNVFINRFLEFLVGFSFFFFYKTIFTLLLG